MDTTVLKRFAQEARIALKNKVGSKINLVLDEESSARRENPKAVKEAYLPILDKAFFLDIFSFLPFIIT